MLFSTSSMVLALATGFAAAGPIQVRSPEALPEYRTSAKRNVFGGNDFEFKDVNAFNQINGFDFNGAINQFGNVNQVFQFQQENLQIVDNGIQQAVIQQVNEVLIVDQQQNRFNDLFRQSNFRNNFNDVTTVVMVVQQIQVAVDDGRGGVFQQDIFAQSALIANQGLGASQTILVSDERQLIATQVLGGFGGGFNAIPTNGVFANGSGNFPTRTNNIALFGAAPTWSAIQRDPAAILGAQWQAELVNLLDNNVFELQNQEELKILEALKLGK